MGSERVQFDGSAASGWRVLLRALAAMALVVLLGVGGFMLVEPGWGLKQALYFTLITLMTVGYDDQGIGEAGRWVAISLMLMGIGTVTWALGEIVQFAVSYQMAWRRRMDGRIKRMDHHVIVCGLGRVGWALCRQLAADGKPFVVIEPQADRVAAALDEGYTVIDGCGTHDQVLVRAGLHRARGLVACTSSDAQNIVITLSARQLHPDLVIVGRANEPEAAHKLAMAGASRVMAPASRAGKDIASYLSNPVLADFLDQTTNGGIGFHMSECMIADDSALIGRSIEQVCETHPKLVVVAVRHAGGTTRIRPGGGEVFGADDIVLVVGPDEVLAAFFQEARGSGELAHREAG